MYSNTMQQISQENCREKKYLMNLNSFIIELELKQQAQNNRNFIDKTLVILLKKQYKEIPHKYFSRSKMYLAHESVNKSLLPLEQ